MEGVAERVDDGHGRPSRQIVDGLLCEHAGDDPIDPAIQIAGDVLQWLADADGAIDKDGGSAELRDGEFKSESGAEGGFFEKEGDGFAVENVSEGAGSALDFAGEVEEVDELVGGEVEI